MLYSCVALRQLYHCAKVSKMVRHFRPHLFTGTLVSHSQACATLQVYLLNKPEDAVLEMLDGLVASVPHLQRLDGFPEASNALAVCSCAEIWSHCSLMAYYRCTVLQGRVCYSATYLCKSLLVAHRSRSL